MDGARRAAPDPALAAVKTWRYLRLAMIGLVAAVVAVVILVFFALGYVFGRIFL